MAIISKIPAVQKALNARPTTPEPRVSGVGTEWYIRLKNGDVWSKRGTKAEMERFGKWLAEMIGSEVEFIQPTGLNAKFADGTSMATGIFVKKSKSIFGDTSRLGKIGFVVRVYDEGQEAAEVMVRYPGSSDLIAEDSRSLVRVSKQEGDKAFSASKK